MHKYMRAVGFSELKSYDDMYEMALDVVKTADERSYTSNSENTMLAQFSKDFADNIGLAVCGEFNEEDKFNFEYCFPYFRGSGISSFDDISVERHAEKESYAGVCDDMRIGVSLIFYVQNMIPYVKQKQGNMLPIRGTTLTLSALSTSGMILLPIEKTSQDVSRHKNHVIRRAQLLAQAKAGNEEAIETLTMEDMDTYNIISKRLYHEDVLSLVDTYFMPYGVECDQYSILAEIMDWREVKNRLTDEIIYEMTVSCNELTFDLCINKMDLYGEPQVGRRFKGSIWMQGCINYPEMYGVD